MSLKNNCHIQSSCVHTNNSQNNIIALIEDHDDFATIFCELMATVGITAQHYSNAVDFLNSDIHKFCCIVSDIRLQGLSGLQLQHELKEKNISTPFILISGHANISMSVKAIKEGAFHFFTKPINNQEVIDCIFEAITQSHKRNQRLQKNKEMNKRIMLLSPAEKKVLDNVIEGLPSKEIAQRMSISKNTVDVHRAAIMKKMQADSLGKLIADVVRHTTN